ncbi:radical SAM protein [candidate division KSB1 bacterium]|nr:radical SAM protein [candidate division KSB1 bacterium]
MKVLLINPPWTVKKGYGVRSNSRWPHVRKDKHLPFPIYLGYTVSVLEKSGIDVSVIDCIPDKLTKEDLTEIVKKEKPQICFIETSTPTFIEDIDTVRYLKNSIIDIKIALFGPHVSVFQKEIMEKYDFIDMIVIGEFEYSIKDISKQKDLSSIDGLIYRKNREIIVNPKTKMIEELDELPFPNRDKFTLKHYDDHLSLTPSMMMIASRGCPFQCSYCLWPQVMYGHRFRKRSPNNVCDEIGLLIDKHQIKEVKFDDDTFALDKNWVIEICNEIIRRNINKKIIWSCFGHITQNDDYMYQKMAEAGCELISFGVESGSKKILAQINKRIDIEKAQHTISICKNYGIRTYCDFMIGLPYETKKDIEKSIETAILLDPDIIQVSYVVPYPGTKMYDKARENDLLIYPEQWDKYASCEAIIRTSSISKEELEKMYYKFWKKFYIRPSYIVKTFRSAVSSKDEFIRKTKGFISFAKRFLI